MKKLAALCGAIVLCISLAAQESILRGVVVETDNKGTISPLQSVVVHWLNSPIHTFTDSNGVFKIPYNSESRKLVFSYVGYKTDTVIITGLKDIRIVMVSKNRLNEVDIVVRRKSTEISYLDPWKTTIMNEKELFKQACCNLAESFETNPSVDVAFTDAVTGARQIQMLGLASQYTQVTQEYMPSIRGIATNYGFSYTPGAWLNSIQVTKGLGSVVNGFESISGVINTELHKSDVKDKLYLNVYAGQGGRYEMNLNLAQKVSPTYSHAILTHGNVLIDKTDHNGDKFLDNPLGYQRNFMYRFKWDISKTLMLQGGIRTLSDQRTGGMYVYDNKLDTTKSNPVYGTKVDAERTDGFIKIGYVFPRKVYKSIGLQVAATHQTYKSFFGLNTYNGTQNSSYANLIYQSIIGSSDHKFKAGVSNQVDQVDEHFFNWTPANISGSHYAFKRNEIVTGGFFEYTFSQSDKFTAVAGLRADYNNLFGMFYTPRVHVRYAMNKKTVWRFSAGTGQRTPNLLAENIGSMVSSRAWKFEGTSTSPAYGFKPERAFNIGMNVTHEFKLNYRPGTFTLDYYYTDFMNQVVVDRDANAQLIKFYNLNGSSYASSFQAQVDYEPIRRLDVRLAYRYYDVKTTYTSGLNEVPLISQQRGFVNVAYTTKSKWAFDVTWQINGAKRLPVTSSNPSDFQLREYSPVYHNVNMQITKSFVKPALDIYVGVENAFNFMQHHPIIEGHHPFGTYFDASMVWGPLFGRMIYGGLRYRI